jgi:hypothetical protein
MEEILGMGIAGSGKPSRAEGGGEDIISIDWLWIAELFRIQDYLKKFETITYSGLC